jgi:pimeloyl-ACP methyl ester carboxylesterase
MLTRVFIHGLESSNKGTKAVFFKERYPDMIIPHFTGELPERMTKLEEWLEGKSGIRLVGSSFGGLMGTLFAMANEGRVDKLILLAPAIHMLESVPYDRKKLSLRTWIYHGRRDEVIPLDKVERAARRYFTNFTFQRVDDDHFLHRSFNTIDWHSLLG